MKKRTFLLLICLLLALVPLSGCGALLQGVLSSPNGSAAGAQAANDTLTLLQDETAASTAPQNTLALLPEETGAPNQAQQNTLTLFDDDAGGEAADALDGDVSDNGAETEFFPLATPRPTAKPTHTPRATHTPAPAIDEDGSYTSRDDVALYLYTYGRLPDNFITKREAQQLGWGGGGLDDYAYGKCIGGDRFGNYEGLLPERNSRRYTECDIDTLHKRSRGAKRIIFSNDGLIYYTDDHYESFTLLYGEE